VLSNPVIQLPWRRQNRCSALSEGAEYRDVCVCVCVCVFLSASLSTETTRSISTGFHAHVTYSHGSILFCRRCDMICRHTFGFMDGVISARSEPDAGTSIALQRVTSLRRRAQDNAPKRRVL